MNNVLARSWQLAAPIILLAIAATACSATGEPAVVQQVGPRELTAETMPAFIPGALATGSVTLDGTTIDYITITPSGFNIGDDAPVFLALPPGGQDLQITQDVARVVYEKQAVDRGWVVVSPASPSGRWFDDDNAGVGQAFAAWIGDWVTIDGGKPHLGGMSNGGLSAFAFAAQNPTGFQSLLAYPGFPRSSDRAVLSELGDIPIRLWVGGDDTQWVESMRSATSELQAQGADVIFTVFPGEPHIIQSTADGVLIFNELDTARFS